MERIGRICILLVALSSLLVSLIVDAAPRRPTAAFNNAAAKPAISQKFRQAAQKKYPSRPASVPAQRFRLGAKNQLKNNFGAQANRRAVNPIKLRKSLIKRLKGKNQKGAVSLGHYPRYIFSAAASGTRRFSMPSNIYKRKSSVQRWRANRKFLDRAIKRGDSFHLATNGRQAKKNTLYARELAYLTSRGYRMNRAGTMMNLPSGNTANRSPSGSLKSGFNSVAKDISKLRSAFRNAASSRG